MRWIVKQEEQNESNNRKIAYFDDSIEKIQKCKDNSLK